MSQVLVLVLVGLVLVLVLVLACAVLVNVTALFTRRMKMRSSGGRTRRQSEKNGY